MVFREQVEKITDGVVIAIVENVASLFHDAINIGGLLDLDKCVDIVELSSDTR